MLASVSPRSCRRKRSAFSLAELMLVIVIVGILAALLSTALQHVRRAGQRASSINDIRSTAAALLIMGQEQGGVLKVWVGGTTGTAGAWPVKLMQGGYAPDARAFYATPRERNIGPPTANWYLYTWGMNLDDARAAQRFNSDPEGYQIRLSKIDNPAETMLLADSILISSARSGQTPPRQTFRILHRQGVDSGTSSGLRTRDGSTVLMAFFDGHVEPASFVRLRQLNYRRVIDESGTIITLPAL